VYLVCKNKSIGKCEENKFWVKYVVAFGENFAI
jgi:hypothetical protein